MHSRPSPGRGRAAFALIVAGTILGIAGVDLVLPAVPGLPQALGGSHATAQLVLAAYVAGSAVGLMLFGSLGARFDQRSLLAVSLAAYGAVSAAAAFSPSIEILVALRLLQGAAGAAAAVFAPGMLRALFGDARAVGALGLLGSLESLTPAFAPIVGVWLFDLAGWRASFAVIAILAAALAAAVVACRDRLPAVIARRDGGSYARLLADPTFMRYALSHALTLGGLLVVIFAAPTVFVTALGAGLADFIVMQLIGIATFVVAANSAGRLTRRFGAEPMIRFGTAVAAAGGLALLGYALAGGGDTRVVTLLLLPFNIGLGLRGPPGFHRAVLAAHGDDARGAALVVVAILAVTAGGTALIAPVITLGLLPTAAAAAVLTVLAVLVLALLPPLREGAA